MPNRPVYPTAPLLERAAHALLAAAAGGGLLVAVVAAFQAPLPDSLAGATLASLAACDEPSTFSIACRVAVRPAVVTAR